MPQTLAPYSVKTEEEVKAFWKKQGIPQKVREASLKREKKFYFADGPPYATGHIHLGTALNKILKDVALRARRMEGYAVLDRPGYDTHGLPIEHKVEKKLGFKSKQDIEKYGVEKFVKACRDYATEFIDAMNAEFFDLGVWMDWDNPYLTLRNEYIENIWWTFKQAHTKGLLYLGSHSVHVCPRCETAVAYNEIEYKKQTDQAVYVGFPLDSDKDSLLVIWTTTPWTLPANTGVMVHPEEDYAFAKSGSQRFVIAKTLVEKVMADIGKPFTIEKTVKGKALVGKTYSNPLSPHLAWPKEQLKDAYRIVASKRYVNLEEGTGLVHTAPGHGKEDNEVGRKEGLPVLNPVGLNGVFGKEVGKYAGGRARKIDKEIVKDLEKSSRLLHKHSYTHDYPFCWRCSTPLLMLATPQWFFNILKLQKNLIKENQHVNWTPSWMKERMANWLESLGDWPVSRERYWGTPLPIWVCDSCNEKEVFGSLKELAKKAKVSKELDLHKPYIDAITYSCACKKGTMHRVSEVLDVWFDAGVSTWAALNFARDRAAFEKYWPADLEIEGTDQVRGWWNAQMITSQICFGKRPYNAVTTHGMVLDVSKAKMSKSKGNILTPAEIIEKHGRDFLRYYLVRNAKGQDLAFDMAGFRDISRFVNILWNTYNFAFLYTDLFLNTTAPNPTDLQPEDRWLLSRMDAFIESARKHYTATTFFEVLASAEDFVMEDVSRTYIKLARDRVGTETHASLQATLHFTLTELLRALAPILPHLTESLYQSCKPKNGAESVHLLSLPKPAGHRDEGLEKEMAFVREATQAALSLREQNKLRLRWPLAELVIVSDTPKFHALEAVLAAMCNVQKVSHAKSAPAGYACAKVGGVQVCLATKADTALRDEWEYRELVRAVQDLRKKAKLTPGTKATLSAACSDPAFIESVKKRLEEETSTVLKAGNGKKEKLLKRDFFLEIKSV